MPNTLNLLTAMIDEDKITITEVLEACGYKVDVVCTDVYDYGTIEERSPDKINNVVRVKKIKNEILIGYDEKIIATKEFR